MDDPQEAMRTGTPQATSPSTVGFNALKSDRLFVVFSDTGEILGPGPHGGGIAREGVFVDDMRVLSRLRVLIGGRPPIFMQGNVDRLNTTYETQLANEGYADRDGVDTPSQSILLTQTRRLGTGVHDRLSLRSFLDRDVVVPIAVEVHSDFRDVFEIRGVPRRDRGRDHAPIVEGRTLILRHEAPDGVILETQLIFDREFDWRDGLAHLEVALSACGRASLEWWVEPLGASDARAPHVATVATAEEQTRSSVSEARFERLALVRTDDATTNAWLDRSAADLSMLLTETPQGLYPYAGLPWFATQFGRDGIITALQTLWCDPSIARGVLGFLAARQATHTDKTQEAQPGKILHEVRHGEMARLGQTPYALYYGGVDQTLLFVILAERYFARTADADFVRQLLPNIGAALDWAATWGDMDGDGFVEYRTDSATGLRNQGWKDSVNAVFHADGRLAEGPIALVEVQAYHVDALHGAARLHRAIGEPAEAAALEAQAEVLIRRIDQAYWMPDLGLWAMALDGDKAQVRTLSSNAAHVLFCGAGLPERNATAMQTLSARHFATGFGLRTVATGSAIYNPMHYHVGSVWPHDTSLAAAGAARAGRTDLAAALFADLRAAAAGFPDFRLPELFCGFDRREVSRASPYLSACAPQAWAAGAPFLMLQAVLGIEIDAVRRRIVFDRPALPDGVDLLCLRRLPLVGRRIDLNIRRARDGATLEVISAPKDTSFVFSR